ncbi:MAG TPA: TonB-dependent receptor [Gemmatimonadales bacterium]|nr:TonB-dependent receptor [Gemmatimonadales bacterium]
MGYKPSPLVEPGNHIMNPLLRCTACAVALCCASAAVAVLHGQSADTTKAYTLPPATVSVTRTTLPLTKVPQSIATIDRDAISRARPTWGLDEALGNIPGVYAANRYNFSQDQRISIRGFGSRSAFSVRGIKILVDGIPQTLPDGQSQLTNLELGEADRIEVLRGSASSLFGNATGGVISIWTNPQPVTQVREDARIVAGRFGGGERPDRNWTKWQSTTGFRVGEGSAQVTVSRLDYEGERDHSAADLRMLNTRLQVPLSNGWSLAVVADYGDNPRADNPGSLTITELHTNRDTVPVANQNRDAGKDVSQLQIGTTVRHTLTNGAEAAVTLFGVSRDLKNPITTTYIDLQRFDYGARASVTYPARIGSLAQRLTAGLDFQQQRDDRKNFNYLNTPGDSAKPDTTRSLDQLEHVTELGPFVQSALELSPHATVTAGLRYDWVKFTVADHLITTTPPNPDDSGDRLMQQLSGSLGITANPSASVTVYGNVGSSFETPTTTELANSPTGAGGFNPDLQPQTALNYELGARGAIDGRLAYSVAIFQADVRNELIPYASVPPRSYYRNAGSTRHRGIELGGDLTIAHGLNFAVSWTYADYQYRSYTVGAYTLDGRAIPGVPKHWLNLVLRAGRTSGTGETSGTGLLHRLWAEVQQTYSSDFFVSDTLNTRTSPWWATNVRVGWEGQTEGRGRGMRFAPFIGVNNAFNHKYVSSVVINAAANRFYEPAPGRNGYVGLSVGAGR